MNKLLPYVTHSSLEAEDDALNRKKEAAQLRLRVVDLKPGTIKILFVSTLSSDIGSMVIVVTFL